MALADSPFRIVVRGEWPAPITLKKGWARAEARRWNDATEDASLRLVRGSAAFLGECAVLLAELGAPSVLSPPLPSGARGTWSEAGFWPEIELALLRKALDDLPPSPSHLVVETDEPALDGLLRIDAAAFSPFWRLDRNGLVEAMEATGNSRVLTIRDATGDPAGFAVVGFGHAISYLQRVAVHPAWQGQGMGRSLVRAATRRAHKHGARAMLLNTQFDNEAAIRLYEEEGFTILRDPLALMRYRPGAAAEPR